MRAARLRAGLSLTDMAQQTHFHRGHLGNVEKGKRAATADVIEAYERVLGEEIMYRRGVLTGLAAGALAPLITPEAVQAGFASALEPGRTIEQWRELLATVGRDHIHLGSEDMYKLLLGELATMPQHMTDPALYDIAARLLVMIGNSSSRTAIKHGAGEWYHLAIKYADRGGDLSTRVMARGRAALSMAQGGAQPDEALQLSREALELSANSSVGRLDSYLAQSHVLARVGNVAGSLTLLGKARKVFSQIGHTGYGSDDSMPEWRHGLTESLILSRVGHKAAQEAQKWVLDTMPKGIARISTQIEMHRGMMLAAQGDRSGVEYARDALNKLPEAARTATLNMVLAETAAAAQRAA
ncbi:helix-turn-helix transcriptional regulator [Longispora urticae]